MIYYTILWDLIWRPYERALLYMKNNFWLWNDYQSILSRDEEKRAMRWFKGLEKEFEYDYLFQMWVEKMLHLAWSEIVPKEYIENTIEYVKKYTTVWNVWWCEIELEFSDDTVLSIATMNTILRWDTSAKAFADTYFERGNKYRNVWYWPKFSTWLSIEWLPPSNSFWNWASMRWRPTWLAFDSEEEIRKICEHSALCTHNHPSAIEWTQLLALTLFYLRNNKDKQQTRDMLQSNFSEYNFEREYKIFNRSYEFDVSTKWSVSEAILIWLEANDVFSCFDMCLKTWADIDTLWMMSASVAWLCSPMNNKQYATVIKLVKQILPKEMTDILDSFENKFTHG